MKTESSYLDQRAAERRGRVITGVVAALALLAALWSIGLGVEARNVGAAATTTKGSAPASPAGAGQTDAVSAYR
jgi:hypothetical protein